MLMVGSSSDDNVQRAKLEEGEERHNDNGLSDLGGYEDIRDNQDHVIGVSSVESGPDQSHSKPQQQEHEQEHSSDELRRRKSRSSGHKQRLTSKSPSRRLEDVDSVNTSEERKAKTKSKVTKPPSRSRSEDSVASQRKTSTRTRLKTSSSHVDDSDTVVSSKSRSSTKEGKSKSSMSSRRRKSFLPSDAPGQKSATEGASAHLREARNAMSGSGKFNETRRRRITSKTDLERGGDPESSAELSSSKDAIRKRQQATPVVDGRSRSPSKSTHRSKTKPRSSTGSIRSTRSSSKPQSQGSVLETNNDKRKDRSKSNRGSGSIRSSRESTLDSTTSKRSTENEKRNNHRPESKSASSTDNDDSSSSETDEPIASLRSSVKVASALLKFRMVLAKSKQTAKPVPEKLDQTGQKENIQNGQGSAVAAANESSSVKPDEAKRASYQKRDSGGSKHKRGASHNSRKDGNSRHNRESRKRDKDAKTSTRMPSSSESTISASKKLQRKSSSVSSAKAKESSAAQNSVNADDADAALKNVISQVGKKLARSGADGKKEPSIIAQVKQEVKGTTANSTAKESPPSKDRIKSSAKVSTAMLKFQQALALSKSATRAAKTQQDTQNKLLGHLHADKEIRTPASVAEEMMLSHGKSQAREASVSPVSTVDMADTTEGKDSPKVPADLDDASDSGDSDINSEIEIDIDSDVDIEDDSDIDVDDMDDDDFLDDVESDSGADEGGEMASRDNPAATDSSNPFGVTTSITIRESEDIESDLDDCSSVDIDSDDDLDSDVDVDSEDDVAGDEDRIGNESEHDSNNNDEDSFDRRGHSAQQRTTDISKESQTVAGDQKSSLSRAEIFSQHEHESDGAKNEVEVVSKGQALLRSLSFTLTKNESKTYRNAMDMSSSLSDIGAVKPRRNQSIAGLSPTAANNSSLTGEESSQLLSYLPKSINNPMMARNNEDPLSLQGTKSDLVGKVAASHPVSSEKEGSDKCSDHLMSKMSRRRLSRSDSNRQEINTSTRSLNLEKSSRRSSSKSRNGSDKSKMDDSCKMLDLGIAPRSRSSSRARRTPARSSSPSSGILSTKDGEEKKKERKPKSSSANGSTKGDKTKPTPSSSRAKTLTGLSTLSSEGENRDEPKKTSVRRKPPRRSKSYGGEADPKLKSEIRERRRKPSNAITLA